MYDSNLHVSNSQLIIRQAPAQYDIQDHGPRLVIRKEIDQRDLRQKSRYLRALSR